MHQNMLTCGAAGSAAALKSGIVFNRTLWAWVVVRNGDTLHSRAPFPNTAADVLTGGPIRQHATFDLHQ